MKYYSILPLSALTVVSMISLMVWLQVIPSGLHLLTSIQDYFAACFYLLIFIIILLESIVYVGFYFPGQFFAVVLVVLNKPSWFDILMLTVCMVAAATIRSWINYWMGKRLSSPNTVPTTYSLRGLLLAMIHMNGLAFFMFNQGAKRTSTQIIWLAGVLNLPYYGALIAATSFLSEEVMYIAENTWVVLIAISIWLMVSMTLDFKRFHRRT